MVASALPFRSSTATGSGVCGERGDSGFSMGTGNVEGGGAPVNIQFDD